MGLDSYRSILKNHKKFKTVHDLENFKIPLQQFWSSEQYARLKWLIFNDKCVTPEITLAEWYNFYHELYKLNNPTNDGL